MDEYRSSVKNLCLPLLPVYCRRCHWMLHKMHFHWPFARNMAGVIYAFDELEKAAVRDCIEGTGRGPDILGPFSDAVSHLDVDWVYYTDPKTGLKIRGRVDTVQGLADGSVQVLDYKTARYKDGDDPFFNLYRGQINSYGYMIERAEVPHKVSRVGLVYFEAQRAKDGADISKLFNQKVFSPSFNVVPVEVKLDPDMVPPLIAEVAGVLKGSEPPDSHPECKDCKLLEELVSLANSIKMVDDCRKLSFFGVSDRREISHIRAMRDSLPSRLSLIARDLEEIGEVVADSISSRGVWANWSDEDCRES